MRSVGDALDWGWDPLVDDACEVRCCTCANPSSGLRGLIGGLVTGLFKDPRPSELELPLRNAENMARPIALDTLPFFLCVRVASGDSSPGRLDRLLSARWSPRWPAYTAVAAPAAANAPMPAATPAPAPTAIAAAPAATPAPAPATVDVGCEWPSADLAAWASASGLDGNVPRPSPYD